MGDIKNSRKMNSKKLSFILNKIIVNAENRFQDNIISKLEIKVGDDFQVILKDIKSLLLMLLYLDISFISEQVECRFALGYGSIYGYISKESHSEMLGAGLTNVNEILNKKDKKYSFFIEDEISKSILLDTIGLLLEDSLSNLTNKQKEFLYYTTIEDRSFEDIQLLMNVKQRAVYYYAERSKYFLIKNIFEKIVLTFESDREKLEEIYYKGIRLDKGIYSE